jgi:hypothetical protein
LYQPTADAKVAVLEDFQKVAPCLLPKDVCHYSPFHGIAISTRTIWPFQELRRERVIHGRLGQSRRIFPRPLHTIVCCYCASLCLHRRNILLSPTFLSIRQLCSAACTLNNMFMVPISIASIEQLSASFSILPATYLQDHPLAQS